MKRPIVWALLFLVAGILCGRYLISGDIVLFMIFTVMTVLVCSAVYRWLKYPPIFLCVILAIAGAIGVQHQLNDVVDPLEDTTFIGIIEDMRYTQAGWQRFIVSSPETRLIAFAPPHYRVEIGQEVKLFGDLFALEGPANPGGYNEFMVQRAHGINGRFNAHTLEAFDVHINLARTTHLIRYRISMVYHQVLPYREAMIMQSVILGERPDSNDTVIEMYRAAGIMHFLVISGLHLSIFMMAICLILERFLNKRIAGIIALIIMISYVLLTGASISTVRALTMAGVIVFGRLLYRDRDSLASVSFACILLLLYQPLYLFSIGFQLSFGTVFGLVILTAPTERFLSLCGLSKYKKLRSALAYNIAASLSTMPIFAYHFGFISTYSIIVNLLIASTATFLVILGILIGVIGLFYLPLAGIMANAIYFLLQFYEAIIRFFLTLPASVILVGNWGLPVTLAVTVTMIAFAYTYDGFGEAFYKRKKILWLCTIVCLCVIGFEALERRRFNITHLDIESYVIRVNNQALIIDGGGNNRLLGMNTGERTLMPYLNYRGIYQAEAAFVTSADRNRITGLIELTMAGRVKVLYVMPTVNLDAGLGLRLRVAADQMGVKIKKLEIGDVIKLGNFEIFVMEGYMLQGVYNGIELEWWYE